jgi:hypothetical protein
MYIALDAVMNHEPQAVARYGKVDEIPQDLNRLSALGCGYSLQPVSAPVRLWYEQVTPEPDPPKEGFGRIGLQLVRRRRSEKKIFSNSSVGSPFLKLPYNLPSLPART